MRLGSLTSSLSAVSSLMPSDSPTFRSGTSAENIQPRPIARSDFRFQQRCRALIVLDGVTISAERPLNVNGSAAGHHLPSMRGRLLKDVHSKNQSGTR